MERGYLKRTRRRMVLCCVLLVSILGFIWGNSALPGEASGQVSGWVGELIRALLPFLPLDRPEGMHILRKIAHFSEFAALGGCLWWLLGMLTKGKFWLPLIGGVAAAGIDETIQLFSPGRYCSIVDVGIDACGVLTGIVLLLLGYTVYRRIYTEQEEKE